MTQQSMDEEDDDAAQGVVLGLYSVDDDEEKEVYRPVLSDTPPNVPHNCVVRLLAAASVPVFVTMVA